MSVETIENKIVKASKWSTITEILAKIISPVLNMILARILAPEAFGVLATVTMVISFAEVFVDSGFQKFLIQRQFTSEEEEDRYMSVAFWTNIGLSVFLWTIIAVFNAQIAELVGNPGKGHLLIVTGAIIPIYSIVGIQSSKLKKALDFKKFFYARIASAFVPLIVTIPLALLGLDYWALIIGNMAGVVMTVIILTALKAFKPMLFFSWGLLKEMFGVGIWTLLDGIAVWLTSWFDAFLVGKFLNEYYLGLYKNSVNTIVSIFTIVTAAIVPVLFSALSKIKDDNEKFQKIFLQIQNILCMILLPMGVGLFLYADTATEILFGSQWKEASQIIGITSLTTALRTIFISLNSDVFRAKGYFKIPLALQVVDLCVTIPICYFCMLKDFWLFVYVRSFLKLFLLVPHWILLWKACRISPWGILKGMWRYVLGCCLLIIVTLVLSEINVGFWWNIFCISVCILIYFSFLCIFKEERTKLLSLFKKRN